MHFFVCLFVVVCISAANVFGIFCVVVVVFRRLGPQLLHVIQRLNDRYIYLWDWSSSAMT